MMKDEVWDIIAAAIHGEALSDKENKVLRQWLEEHPEDRKIYDRLEDFYTENRVLGEINVNKAWEKNRRMLNQKKKVVRKRLYRSLGYAAGMILIIGMGTAFWFSHRSKMEKTYPVVAQLEIRPGAPKALLTLASGEKIDLERNEKMAIRENAGWIKNENHVLQYSSQNNESSVLEYHTLNIPRGGEYQLKLEDGTLVWLNSETQLRYPITFGKKERRLYLEGEAYFQVNKDPGRPFVVCAGGIDVTALGTEFNVLTTEDGTEATLVEGSVKINTDQGETQILSPSQQAVYDRASRSVEVRPVNTALYTSWKDGYYAFDKQPLQEIMNTLARWYDIQVFFGDQEVAILRFSGRLKRYENISNLLTMIKLTNDVNFEIKEKTIIVRGKVNRK